jgi:hypothetical protein
MNYFQNLTNILKDYKAQVDVNIKVRDETIQKANADYKDAFLTQTIEAAKSDFTRYFESQRIQHMKDATSEISALRQQVKDKASKFNPDTINEVLALKNIKLTPAEIKMFSEKYKGDYMAQRILSEIAESSGYRLNTVFADTLLDVIDQADALCANFIEGYDGNEYKNLYTMIVCQKKNPLETYEKAFDNDIVPCVVKKELSESQMQVIHKMFSDCSSEEDYQNRAKEISSISGDLKESLQASEEYSKYVEPDKAVIPIDEETQAKVKMLTKHDGPLRDLFLKDPTYAPYVAEVSEE